MKNKVTLSLERYHELYEAYDKYIKLELKNVVIIKHPIWGHPNIETITTIDEVTLKILIELNEAQSELSDMNNKYNDLNKEYDNLKKLNSINTPDISNFANGCVSLTSFFEFPWYKRIFNKESRFKKR